MAHASKTETFMTRAANWWQSTVITRSHVSLLIAASVDIRRGAELRCAGLLIVPGLQAQSLSVKAHSYVICSVSVRQLSSPQTGDVTFPRWPYWLQVRFNIVISAAFILRRWPCTFQIPRPKRCVHLILLYFVAVIIHDEHSRVMFVHLNIPRQFKRTCGTPWYKAVDIGADGPCTFRYSAVRCAYLLQVRIECTEASLRTDYFAPPLNIAVRGSIQTCNTEPALLREAPHRICNGACAIFLAYWK